MNKHWLTYIFLLINLFLFYPANCEELKNLSEVLNLKAENNNLLIEVAKKYPEVKITQYQNPSKILIELLGTKYHKQFSFNIPIKSNLLAGLDFTSEINVGFSKYGEGLDEKQKVAIILTVKDNQKLNPKIVSTKDNIVKIAFLLSQEEESISVSQNNPSEALKDALADKTITLFNTAVEEHMKGNLNQAEELYKQVLSKDGNFYLASFNLAKLYVDKRDYDASITLFNELLNKFQNEPDENIQKENLAYILNSLGDVYLLKDDLDRAEEKYNEALKINENSFQSYFKIGLIAERKQDLSKAQSYFKKTIDLKPDYAESYYHLGVINLLLNDKKEAKDNFKKVVELTPTSEFANESKIELAKIEKRFFRKVK